MAAHEQMLLAANLISLIKGEDNVSASEIFAVLKSAGSTHPITTIHAEMLRCCINCPRDNETPHDYFKSGTHRNEYQLIKKLDLS